jgi:hypothetical protein
MRVCVLIVAFLSLVSIAGAQSETRNQAFSRAQALLNRLGLDLLEPREHYDASHDSWIFNTAEVSVELSRGANISIMCRTPATKFSDDGTRALLVTTEEDAIRIAEQFVNRAGLRDYAAVAVAHQLDHVTRRYQGWVVSFEHRAPGGYRGSVNRATLAILAVDGSLEKFSAVLHHTYEPPDVRISSAEAAECVSRRIEEVYGSYGGTMRDARVAELGYSTDYLPEDDTSGRYSTRGELADDYGPPRGGVHRSRLAYLVIGTISFRPGGEAEFNALVDAKDGTVMYGRVEESKSGKRGAPPAAALARTAAAGRRKLGFDPVRAGMAALALGGAGLAYRAVRRRKAVAAPG